MDDDKLVRGLGWLSLGLAVPPLVVPGAFGNAPGTGDASRHHDGRGLERTAGAMAAVLGITGDELAQEGPA